MTAAKSAEAKVHDQLAISEMLTRYAFAVDTIGNNPPDDDAAEDPALESAAMQLAECLTDDGRVYLFFEGPDGPAIQAGDGGPAEFAAFVRAYFTEYDYVGTYHLVSNVLIDFTGDDTAKVRSYINSTHWMSDDRMLLAPILYVDEAKRAGNRWKILRRHIEVQRFWVTEGYAPEPTNPALTRPE